MAICCFIATCLCIASGKTQGSKFVELMEDGYLNYSNFSLNGESSETHRVPDYSYAGYRMGGFKIPYFANMIVLEPKQGDCSLLIQQAIDSLSHMPPDIYGFRGAILLKAGRYEVAQPLHIIKNGIVLRGEGQNTASAGGTEIVATASTQYTLINFEGNLFEKNAGIFLDKALVSEAGKWTIFNVAKAIDEAADMQDTLTFKITSRQNDYNFFHSKENENAPVLKVYLSNDSLIELTPTDDAFVRGGIYANDNYGSDSSLAIKSNLEYPRYTRESYLKFIIPRLPANADSANLYLYSGKTVENIYNNISLMPGNSWSEQMLTFNSRPTEDLLSTPVPVTSENVPIGAVGFSVTDASTYREGQEIIIEMTPNSTWIDTMNMQLYGWQKEGYQIRHLRIIEKIYNDSIVVNVPLVQQIYKTYGGAMIYENTTMGWLENSGIENMMLTSTYDSEEDENHAWEGIRFTNTRNCWALNVTAKNFAYSCITLNNAFQTTVEECAMLDPKSEVLGGRRYSFAINGGSFNLFQRCYARNGRHDYVTNSRVTGPNVFLDCVAENPLNDIGPHQRYATGILFDNIQGGIMRIQNRKDFGTGHGWAGAQIMFWNLKSNDIIKVESPVTGINWGIGCNAQSFEGEGPWQSKNDHINPRSLYIQQLTERMETLDVDTFFHPAQLRGDIIENIGLWKGIGTFPDSVFSNNTFINENELKKPKSAIKIYPNPCKNFINVRYYEETLNDSKITYQIYSPTGSLKTHLLQKELTTIDKLDVSFLNPGPYYLLLKNKNGEIIYNQLIIKTK